MDFYRKVKEKYNTKTGKLSAEEKKKVLLSLPDDAFIVKSLMKTEK